MNSLFNMNRYFLTMLIAAMTALAAPAQETQDSDLAPRYNRLFSLSDPDSVQTFYEVSAQRIELARQQGDLAHYYDMLINEISYEASAGRYTNAIKKASEIMDDIKGENNVGEEYYSHVYKSLGSIFENRGNYQMASQYYERALRLLVDDQNANMPKERHNLIGSLYAALARVNLHAALHKAWEWNETLGWQFGDDPYFRKPYLSHKARIYFYRHQLDSFLVVKKQFDEFIRSPQAPQYGYSERKLGIMENVVTGNSERALWQVDSMVAANQINLDAAMRIHDAMGRKDLALEDAYRLVHLQDSLNDELVNENIQELYLALGTDKVQRKHASEREYWMKVIMWLLTAVIILLLFAIILIITRLRARRRLFKQIADKNEQLEKAYEEIADKNGQLEKALDEIEQKNGQLEKALDEIEHQKEQLEVALDEAKESDRAKTAFVQHVSHEMRTPLNIITGNAQVIASLDYELSVEERTMLLDAINENTVAITNIVNDLLEMSLTTSKGRYRRDDLIAVNDLGRTVVQAKEGKNEKHLKLTLETSLPEDFTIQSNYGGIERILVHLLGNALKFTEKGSVELLVRESDDGNNVEFVVTDTGIGISEEYRERIFEHFYKIDPFKQGMGIGLSMARKVAVGLGGSLELDPDYHDGTRMVLTIPAAKK